MIRFLFLLLGCVFASNAVGIAVPLDQTPVRGLWWNPANPGHGIDLHRSPDQSSYSLIWYTYDEDAAPVWYIGAGERSDDEIQMELLRFTWDEASATASGEPVGEIRFVFQTTDQGRLIWSVGPRSGEEPLQVFSYSGGLPPLDVNGLWADPEQTGWGLSISAQGSIQLAVHYYYDADGHARWAIGQTPASESTIPLLSFTGPCPGCDAVPVESSASGELEFAAESPDRATLSTRTQYPGIPASSWVRDDLSIERLTDGLYQDGGLPNRVQPDVDTVFVNARVLPMDQPVALSGQTVWIRGGTIEQMGETIDVPQGSVLIRADGRWLMPGLMDSHVHLVLGTHASNDLFTIVAQGVTSVRQMWGQDGILTMRNRIDSGQVIGPRIFSASPGFEAPPAYWPQTVIISGIEQARSAVRGAAQEGFDFIKVYNNLSLDQYRAILDEADQRGLRAVGHVSSAVGLFNALDAGQLTIEHLAGYAREVTQSGSWSGNLNPDRLADATARTAEAGTWNTPTHVVIDRSRNDIGRIRQSPEWRFLSPEYRAWFDNTLTQPGPPLSTIFLNNRLTTVRTLWESGAGLLVGTDSGVQYVLPGSSVYEELDFFVQAGVPRFETLQAATYNPAVMMGREQEMGSVRPGRAADLLLLEQDPRISFDHLQQRTGVMARGRWWSAEELQTRLDLIADQYLQ